MRVIMKTAGTKELITALYHIVNGQTVTFVYETKEEALVDLELGPLGSPDFIVTVDGPEATVIFKEQKLTS